MSRTLDVIACNPGVVRLFAGLGEWPVGQRNFGWYAFLHPLAHTVLHDWDERARAFVGRLRVPDRAELVDELRARKEEFAALLDRFAVRPHAPGPDFPPSRPHHDAVPDRAGAGFRRHLFQRGSLRSAARRVLRQLDDADLAHVRGKGRANPRSRAAGTGASRSCTFCRT
ncbi:MmyB family transcriptional regulator [Streptomyces sp. NBC_01361]|uniref:MmyB family transcriptional regulator n=1 Tax=Streptomyces sp. NBC_01361 TaxID=2903838 RepID=UPI002E305FB5|nr:hypothetical protein [Streptomyces sp. NBC_01361]